MKIKKQIICLHCGVKIECIGNDTISCQCESVRVLGESVIHGVLGQDYMDVSPVLLNE